jgi:hypothetical protein
MSPGGHVRPHAPLPAGAPRAPAQRGGAHPGRAGRLGGSPRTAVPGRPGCGAHRCRTWPAWRADETSGSVGTLNQWRVPNLSLTPTGSPTRKPSAARRPGAGRRRVAFPGRHAYRRRGDRNVFLRKSRVWTSRPRHELDRDRLLRSSRGIRARDPLASARLGFALAWTVHQHVSGAGRRGTVVTALNSSALHVGHADRRSRSRSERDGASSVDRSPRP